MSINRKILLPLLASLLLGLFLSLNMAWQMTRQSDAMHDTIEKTLSSTGAAGFLRQHFDALVALTSRVTSNTVMIMPDEITAEFNRHAGPMAEAVQTLRDNALSEEVATLAQELQDQHNLWLYDTMLVLGLRSGSEIPTMEVLARHERAMSTAIATLYDLTGSEARAVMQQSNTAMRQTVMITLGFGVLVLLLGAVGAVILAINLTRPLLDLVKSAEALAQGNTSVEFAATKRRDEIGVVARAIAGFRDGVVERARLAEESRENLQTQSRRQQRIEELVAAFKVKAASTLEFVEERMTVLSQTSQGLSQLVKETASRSELAAQASSTAASNVSTVASASEELSASISNITQTVQVTTGLIDKATGNTQNTAQRVTDLAKAAERIGTVLQLIQDIAGQTNLLALNATIEAARAGEAGKGFAVVASEVKALANQTATATEEISTQISTIQTSTQDSVSAIQAISSNMEQVNESARTIAGLVQEQGHATKEISINVNRASDGSQEVDGNIEAVSKAVMETSGSARELADIAEQATLQTRDLRQSVEQFLEEVAAA